MYTPQEIAEMLKVSVDVVIELLEQEKMRGVKVGEFWRITPEQLDAFIKKNSTGDKKLTKRLTRYSKLEHYLKDIDRGQKILDMRFSEVESIIEYTLPPSAYKYRAWWASDITHSQCMAWINAGWIVEFVDMKGQFVRFIRGGTDD